MRNITAKTCLLTVIIILATAYYVDFDIFKGLLTWTLGGVIILLLNVAFFGNLIKSLMKNKEVQEFIQLFREGKDYLKKILENQREKRE